jgi:protease I
MAFLKDCWGRIAAALLTAVLLSVSPVSAAWAESKPVLLVIAHKMVADPEYLETRKAIEAAGLAVEVAGVNMDVATGYGDLKVKPDLVIPDIKLDRYRAVVLIGGEGAMTDLWDNATLHGVLRDATARGLWVAAICAAPVTLARANLLSGKAATTYPSPENVEALKKAGALYRDEPVVTDGRLVTGNGPDASAAFGKRLAELFAAG